MQTSILYSIKLAARILVFSRAKPVPEPNGARAGAGAGANTNANDQPANFASDWPPEASRGSDR